MSDCPECELARVRPLYPVFMAGCLGCEVRALSDAPKFIREATYDLIKDPEEREAMKTAVALEYRRRKAMA